MALIYIVEDDENIREIETIALKNSNYMVCAFEKATTFYKKLEDIMPDLVLLDVMLPDESGYDIFIIFYDINQCHNFSLCLSLYIPLQHQAGRPCLHKTALSHVFYLFLIIAYDM